MAVLALVIVPATGSRPTTPTPARKTLTFTSWQISRLAADGERVAVVTVPPSTNLVSRLCDHIVVWDVAKKKPTKSVIDSGVCLDETVGEMLGLAVAGNKVAWLEGSGGMQLDMEVEVANLGVSQNVVAEAGNGNGAQEYPDGSWLGNLAGKGNLIAFDHWNVCTALPPGADEPDSATCTQPAPGADAVEFLTDQQLQEVAGKTSVTIARAPNELLGKFAWGYGGETEMPLRVIWVDGGRILVQRSDTLLAIYSASGSLLRQIKAAHSTAFGDTVLQGSQLLTLVSPNKLALYNASSGAFVRTIRVKGSSVELRDLQSGLAVYLDIAPGRDNVHVMRLANGKSFVINPPGCPVDAQTEPAGLYYAYNVGGVNGGRVVFMPFSKVVKKLR
jgi:hypothetical protein